MNVRQYLTKFWYLQDRISRPFLPLLIFLIGLVFSLQQYDSARDQAEETLKARFNVAFNEVTLNIVEKIEAYEQMLRATQGLFYASDEVSRQEFRHFSEALELDVFYPGILGLGYAPLIKPEEKNRHIAEIRQSGFPQYDIHPAGERDFYTSILYLEPFSNRNLRAFGYDMSSEANRREAMLRARDTRRVALSAGVKLVQDLSEETSTGLLIYLPLFEDVTILGAPRTQHQKIHQGWVYSVFRIDDVVKETLEVSSNVNKFRIRDITESQRQILFQAEVLSDERLSISRVLRLGGRLWQFEAQPDDKFIADYEDSSPLWGLLIGLFFSVALGWISWLIMNGRFRAELLASTMTAKLREQNQRLSLATETAHMGIWDWDFHSDQVFIEGSLAQLMLGKSQQNNRLSYQDWLQKIERNDQQLLDTAIKKAINNRQELNIEVLVQPVSASTRMMQISGVLRFNDAGQPVGMLGVSFDITDSWLSKLHLQQTEARWKHALEGSGAGVWDWSVNDDKVIFSDRLVSMLGYQPDEFQSHLSEWADRVHTDDRQSLLTEIDGLLDGSKPEFRHEHRLQCKDGRWKWVLARGNVIERDVQGHALRAIGTLTDISWRKEAEINLRQSEERFRNAFDTAPIGMALVGLDGRWLEVNDALCEMLGYRESELLALTFADITHPEDLDLDLRYVNQLIAGDHDHYQMEKRYFDKNGQIVDVLLSVSVVHDAEGKVLHFVSQIEDITDRKREQERIRVLAFYDALTELPNRRLFDERISHAMLAARRHKQQLALMFIDVDHFKHINDSYGHDIGDEVIKAVADRMSAVLRASDTLARFGGDEFVVLLTDVPNPASALKVAENLRRPFIEKLQFNDQAIRITLSIGVALWNPQHDETLASWMKKADIALYDVKARGRNAAGLYQSAVD